MRSPKRSVAPPPEFREGADVLPDGGAPALINALERFIRQHPRLRFSLRDVASILGYETTYCCKIFRRTTGKRFSDWDRDIRIRMAQERLLRSRATIDRIAEAVGYQTRSAFERSFRKAAGMAPSAWRRRQRVDGAQQ